MNRKDSLYLFALATLALVGIFVLAILGRPVEQELWTIAGLVIGGFVGIARQADAGPAQGVTFPGAVAPQVHVNGGPTTDTTDTAPLPATYVPASLPATSSTPGA